MVQGDQLKEVQTAGSDRRMKQLLTTATVQGLLHLMETDPPLLGDRNVQEVQRSRIIQGIGPRVGLKDDF